jgi:hypothetical protein
MKNVVEETFVFTEAFHVSSPVELACRPKPTPGTIPGHRFGFNLRVSRLGPMLWACNFTDWLRGRDLNSEETSITKSQ